MNFLNATKRAAAMFGVTAGLVFATGAFAQDVDTAYVPFRVNVAANILAEYKSGTTVVASAQTSASAFEDVTLAVPLPEGTGVLLPGSQRRGMSLPVVSGNGGGKVALNLPAQSYKNATVALYSVNGKRVLSEKFSASQTVNSVSRRNIVAGVYLLSIKGTDDAASVTSRVTHRGGSLEINAAFGGDNISSVPQMAKQAADGGWTITVSATETGYVDSVYTLKLTSGINPKQNITLCQPSGCLPDVPSNLTATTASSSSIMVSWSAVPKATVYRVYRATDESGTYTLLGTSTTTSYTNTGLSRGTAYYYKVSAFNSVGESAQSSYISATIVDLDTPEGIRAFSTPSNGITVTWWQVNGADGYNVYRSTSATGTYTLIDSSATSSYTSIGLSLGSGYYFKVTAYNSTGESFPSSSVLAWVVDMFVDTRDNRIYETVTIGTQTWMSENLSYKPETGNSWCYGNSADSCNKYGRLYDWTTAMDVDALFGDNIWGVDTKHQGVCPAGWHLPSEAEWSTLAKYAGGTGDYGVGGTAGKQLKSRSTNWRRRSDNTYGVGTDNFDFTAQPGGCRGCDGYSNTFYFSGSRGYWWTATENTENGNDAAYSRYMSYDSDGVPRPTSWKYYGFSVRCLRD